jgi:RHS repeat-associated protein
MKVSNSVAVTLEVNGTNFWINSFVTGVGTQQVVAAIRDAAGNIGYATNEFCLTVVTNGAYQYNAAGCVTNIAYSGADYTQNVSLGWNSQYQLTSAGAASNLVQYGYDVLGRRESRAEGTNVVNYVYTGNQVAADLDENGNVLRSYTWGPGIDNLLAFTDHTTSNTYYALKDHLNTVHALIDGSGTIVERYEYDAWGKVIGVYNSAGTELPESAIGNRYLWQGREYDFATSLFYFRARWYDPVAGRWLSKDPIGISGGLNQYVFCANNPVNFIDPYGLITLAEHYSRNNNQTGQLPPNPKAAKETEWNGNVPADYHRQGQGAAGNVKYVSPDGHYEAVYNKNGNLVTDPVNRGTYNFNDPVTDPSGHFKNDVWPYWKWGNGPDDPTSLWNRMTGKGYNGSTSESGCNK